MKRETIILILAVGLLASCNSAKHVRRSTTTVDSTVIQENRMLKEAVQEMSHTIEKLTTDSSSQVVVFESVIDTTGSRLWTERTLDSLMQRVPKPKTIVKFRPDKSIESIETDQRIKSITAQANKSESIRDSLQVRVWALEDSTAKLQASKRVETATKTVDVKRKSLWWLWMLIGGAITLIIRNNWRSWAFRLFGWKGKPKSTETG